MQDALPSRGEQLADGIDVAARPARVRIRYRTDISSSMRVLVGRRVPGEDGADEWLTDRTAQIITVPAEIGNREGLEFMVEDYLLGRQFGLMATSRGGTEVRRFMVQVPAQIETKLLRGAARAAANVVADEAKERSISAEVSDAIRSPTRAEPGTRRRKSSGEGAGCLHRSMA